MNKKNIGGLEINRDYTEAELVSLGYTERIDQGDSYGVSFYGQDKPMLVFDMLNGKNGPVYRNQGPVVVR
jgi:hypothetical protein